MADDGKVNMGWESFEIYFSRVIPRLIMLLTALSLSGSVLLAFGLTPVTSSNFEIRMHERDDRISLKYAPQTQMKDVQDKESVLENKLNDIGNTVARIDERSSKTNELVISQQERILSILQDLKRAR